MKEARVIELQKHGPEEIHMIVKDIIMTTCRSSEFSAQVAASAIYSVLEEHGMLKKEDKESKILTNFFNH